MSPTSFRFTALALLVAILTGTDTRAALKTWAGSSGGNWNTSANWTPGGVPAAGDDLVAILGSSFAVINTLTGPRKFFRLILD